MSRSFFAMGSFVTSIIERPRHFYALNTPTFTTSSTPKIPKSLFIASGIIMAILGTSLYYLLLTLRPDSFWATLAITTGIVVITFLPWPVLIAYINERFQTGVRASAYGLAYSLAVILPSFYFVYQTWLSALMPFEYTSLVLLAVGAVLISIGAAWGPETKDVDFISAGERTELPATLGRDE